MFFKKYGYVKSSAVVQYTVPPPFLLVFSHTLNHTVVLSGVAQSTDTPRLYKWLAKHKSYQGSEDAMTGASRTEGQFEAHLSRRLCMERMDTSPF